MGTIFKGNLETRTPQNKASVSIKQAFTLLICWCLHFQVMAATLHIGTGQTYPTLTAAANVAQSGDTLLMHGGIYTGGLYIQNLKGTQNQWITIKNVSGETVILQGGNNAMQLSDPAYLHILGLVFQGQTGNGVNIDDGGTYDTPAHHVVLEQCIFRDMAVSGNNDLLKLSGLDYFEVLNCQFLNGAAGGSGIDMVGCHFGKIHGNRFENMGSNSIQCKGGSENVRIEANFFKNGGLRTLNIGGSTGLQFFRPDTAHFEAARVYVFSNIIVGSQAPVAFVGAVEVEVANNTIYRPDKWVIRILQETVDPSRFLPCGDNLFRNNIVILSNINTTVTNIGPNTAPETFTFSNNLWFNIDNSTWAGPDIPVAESNQVLNQNPLLNNPTNEVFTIPMNSPAVGQGLSLVEPKFDFLQQLYANPPSIGAIEANPASYIFENNGIKTTSVLVFPNPTNDLLSITFPNNSSSIYPFTVSLRDITGRVVFTQMLNHEADMISIGHLPKGLYVISVDKFISKIMVAH